ncbi:glycosyltransferase [Spirilliplanes yamanashiensis]|uniref:Glycosyltransferase n=1 Tax=Spirilliplanes yamanashiensis TaxID=42233 RepID=A0A8J3Y6P9_9ACTN|nr:glycosyltransferase family 4 protein [Spirilliplanes yamanashiensis]MDP9814783.1 hypothetical protein [Spirilliplanes yamanashiensis]GIJ02437.1 hypothetical protein Sya03_17890 [Spirilliplanes yamanashiensis]
MALTIVSTFFPLPQDRGDPVRVLMLLRAVAAVRGYTLLAVRRPETTDAEVEQLRGLLPGVEVRDHRATPYRLNRLGPLGRHQEALLAGLPAWVRTRYSGTLHADLAGRGGAAVAIGEAAAAYFPGTTLDWHWDKANVLAASTRQDAAEATTAPHRLRARFLTAVSTRFEGTALARCRTVSVTSADEDARLLAAHGRRADFVVPSCVPLPDGHRPRPVPRRLVWLSSFSYRSNLLGLLRFLDEGWPALRAAGHTLALVGSGLTGDVRARLAAYDGLEVLGFADDLRPVLASARAGVVPLWSGAGVKLKTLTLLAHSVPVFSTPVGAEGVPPTDAVAVADTPAAMARQILDTSGAELDRRAAVAHRLVAEQFSAARFGSAMIGALARHGYLDPDGTRAGS